MWCKYKENKSLYERSHFCCRVVRSASLIGVLGQWERPAELCIMGDVVFNAKAPKSDCLPFFDQGGTKLEMYGTI